MHCSRMQASPVDQPLQDQEPPQDQVPPLPRPGTPLPGPGTPPLWIDTGL